MKQTDLKYCYEKLNSFINYLEENFKKIKTIEDNRNIFNFNDNLKIIYYNKNNEIKISSIYNNISYIFELDKISFYFKIRNKNFIIPIIIKKFDKKTKINNFNIEIGNINTLQRYLNLILSNLILPYLAKIDEHIF